jgi:ribosomal protein S18 acetylase RimI-like enzyme
MRYSEEIPETDDYYGLFLTTGWNDGYHFTKEQLKTAIKNSWYIVSAHEGPDLTGFGRIISDGIHHALIVDLIVHPKFQGRGIGGKIIQMLIEKCKLHDIKDVQLFSAKNKTRFYEKYGFSVRDQEAPGMQLKTN